MAFLLAVQIVHRVITHFTSREWFKDSMRKNIHSLALLHWLMEMCSTSSSSNNAHTLCAITQYINECLQSSNEAWQKQHSAIFLWNQIDLVGIDWRYSLHKKTRNLFGTFTFRILHQSFPSADEDELDCLPSSQSSCVFFVFTRTLYAERTKKGETSQSAMPIGPVISIDRKCCWSTSRFQDPDEWSNISETKVGGLFVRATKGRSLELRGIQLPYQILVLWPLPILLKTPRFKASLPSNIALHIWLGLLPRFACIRSQLGKYRDFSILALKELGSNKIRQACLARSAILNNYVSRNPSPPMNLGIVSVSPENQQGFLCPCLLPHQKFLSSASFFFLA
jgi:hypothetical protein